MAFLVRGVLMVFFTAVFRTSDRVYLTSLFHSWVSPLSISWLVFVSFDVLSPAPKEIYLVFLLFVSVKIFQQGFVLAALHFDF